MNQIPASSSPWPVVAAVSPVLALLTIDLFAVNVALPAIADEFGANLASAEWVISVYAMMLGVLPMAMGRLGDIKGRRRTYLAGLALFVAASVACGLATEIGALIAFRAIQGVGASIMMPLSLTLVIAAFAPTRRGLAVGLWGGISGLGLIAGPLVGGLLANGNGWRWIFFINVPIGLVAWLATRQLAPESRDPTASGAIDWRGMGLLSAGLFLLVLAFFLVRDGGWLQIPVLASAGASVLLLALFVAAERATPAPLLDLRLFRNKTFVAAAASSFFFSAAVFGSQPFVSLLMQNTWGFTPLQGGLGFLPATALVALTLPLAGWLGGRLGGRLRIAIVGGSLAVLASALLLATLTPASGYRDGLLLPFLIRGLGIGIFISSVSLAALSSLPDGSAGLASGVLSMSRNVDTAWGIALLGSVYTDAVETGWAAVLTATSDPTLKAGALLFTPGAGGLAQEATKTLIVAGFVETALVAALLCASATVIAVFVRHRSPATAADIGPGSRPLGTPTSTSDVRIPILRTRSSWRQQ